MNKFMIIGNLTRDPETRTTQGGKTVCNFTVAVNRRNKEGTDYFRVSAWNKLGETCQRYLAKGRKVAVTGSVSLNTYTSQNGENRATLEVFADEVEFLSTKNETAASAPSARNNGYEEVTDDDLPF